MWSIAQGKEAIEGASQPAAGSSMAPLAPSRRKQAPFMEAEEAAAAVDVLAWLWGCAALGRHAASFREAEVAEEEEAPEAMFGWGSNCGCRLNSLPSVVGQIGCGLSCLWVELLLY